MNARQKAKFYKKLYEQCKIPIHTIHKTKLNHLRAKHMIPNEYLKSCCMHGGEELAKSEITNILMHQLKPYIQESMICEIDKYTGDNVYTVDIWIR